MKRLLTAAALSVCILSFALDLIPEEREFTLKTPKISLTVRDGLLLDLQDLKQKQTWSSRALNDPGIPAGLGILHDVANLRKVHMPWGEPTLNQHLPLNVPLLNYFIPNAQSQYKVERQGSAVRATWTGLSNGRKFLADAELTITFKETPDGGLAIQTSGKNPGGGVIGATLPLINIPNQAKFIFANFGGMEYSGKGVPGLMPFGGSPFAEAPIMILQDGGNSMSLWMEDPTMRPFYIFFRRSGKSISLAFENFNLMPFEKNTAFQSPVISLNVFKGDWKAAATPFRDWYQTCFKKDIAVRDGVPWADGIKAIFDIYMNVPNDKTLEDIARHFPPEKVMFQIWNARAPNFDTDLPDWTPRAGYIDGIARLHKHGFKAMAYVNTYCANYLSPVWKKDNLNDIFMTRKNSIPAYKGSSIGDTTSAIHEKLIGTVDYTEDPAKQFDKIPAGRLLYGDPLSAKWRTYHAQMMKTWNSTTKTDANYEDTAGCVADNGNGIVDGLSAGEGSIAAMRELQKTQPHVPMSSEYGPAGIAFATKWALNYAGHWGYDDFKRYRIHHQHPVNAYLYGYRQWVSAMMGDRDLICHTMASTSDSTGGLGFSLYMLNPDPKTLRSDYSFRRHLYERSKIFTERDLYPWFPKGDYPEHIRAQYRGKDGIYSYYNNKALEQMLDPNGRPLYGRAFGTTRVKTTLWLHKWPAQNGTEIFGLDPMKHYPLFPKPADAENTMVQIPELPDKVYLKQYHESPDSVLLELAALPNGPKEIELTLHKTPKLTEVYANDRKDTAAGKIRGTLPLRITAVKTPEKIVSGSMIGTPPPNAETENIRGIPLYRQNSGLRSYPLAVTGKDDALIVYFRNRHEKYPWHGHDGTVVRLLVNGKETASFDSLVPNKAWTRGGKEPRLLADTRLRSWSVPLGAYAGKTVLITVETDMKKNTNWDNQMVSVPKLIRDPAQKFAERVFDGSFRIVKHIGTPKNWGGGPVADVKEAPSPRKGIRNIGKPQNWNGGTVTDVQK